MLVQLPPKSEVEATIQTIPGATYYLNANGDTVTMSTDVVQASKVSIPGSNVQ